MDAVGVSTATTPDDIYKNNILLTADEAAALEIETRGQSKSNPWFLLGGFV